MSFRGSVGIRFSLLDVSVSLTLCLTGDPPRLLIYLVAQETKPLIERRGDLYYMYIYMYLALIDPS